MGELKIQPAYQRQLTIEEQDKVITLTADAMPIKRVCETIGISNIDFYLFCKAHPLFEQRLHDSRTCASHILAEDVVEISRRTDLNPQIQRNQMAGNQWLASKRNSKMYGDKMDINVTATIDVSGILDAAERRVTALQQPTNSQMTQLGEIIEVSYTDETGLEPVLTKAGRDISDLI